MAVTLPAADIVQHESGAYGIDTRRYGDDLQTYLKKSLEKGIKQVAVVLKRPSRSKSVRQERTYFGLLPVMIGSGCHSYQARDTKELHDKIKMRHAHIITDYYILLQEGVIKAVRQPDETLEDAGGDWVPIPKSESDWTVEESSTMIQIIIDELEGHGIMSLSKDDERGKWMDKYETIRKGMEANERARAEARND